MPRPKKEGVEPKRRSRHGCWPCKARKIKCGEEKPACLNCQKQGEACDYSIRLNWDGRKRKADDNSAFGTPISFGSSDSPHAQPAAASASPTSHPLQHETAAQHLGKPSSSARSLFNVPPHRSPSFSNIPTPGRSDDYDGRSPGSSSTYWRAGNASIDETSRVADELHTSHSTKRQRISESRTPEDSHTPQASDFESTLSRSDVPPYPSPLPPTPNSPEVNRPVRAQGSGQLAVKDDAQDRRLSVRSLLGPDTDDSDDQSFGFDQGRIDIDVPRNDDFNALQAFSPSATLRQLSFPKFEDDFVTQPSEFGFGLQLKDSHPDQPQYYATPVPVRIPRAFLPLPDILQDTQNRMNLLYFHHFLNHTATILVPHDCPLNPFRIILPRMAIRNKNLMSLLLAYSASHRAKFLNHPEPSNRIAEWTKDVFTNLRVALEKNDVSDASLAAAIMLASLEIISPGAWGVDISWQNHLGLARQMMIARGGYRFSDSSNNVTGFLSRWYVYLDLIGSLSGTKYDRPAVNPVSSDEIVEDINDTEIDCVLGFTPRCLYLLAQIADMAKRSDMLRIGPDGVIDSEWKAPPDIVAAADYLKTSLERSRKRPPRACTHSNSHPSRTDAIDTNEMMAVNDAYHWAGMIHIESRILNHKSDRDEIQHAVSKVVRALGKVKLGSSAEACLVFPIFSAGVEAKESFEREILLERLLNVEKSGMTQVRKARTLMQRVWETKEPWETLVQGEFVG